MEKDLKPLTEILPPSLKRMTILADDWNPNVIALGALLGGLETADSFAHTYITIRTFENFEARIFVEARGCAFWPWPSKTNEGRTGNRRSNFKYDRKCKMAMWMSDFIEEVGGVKYQ